MEGQCKARTILLLLYSCCGMPDKMTAHALDTILQEHLVVLGHPHLTSHQISPLTSLGLRLNIAHVKGTAFPAHLLWYWGGSGENLMQVLVYFHRFLCLCSHPYQPPSLLHSG